MKAAGQNPAQAKFARGKTLAENGKDPDDVDQGYRLMEEAASEGDPALQYQLAMLYVQGTGDEAPGQRRAMKISTLLTQAADQGHLPAMRMLARLYIKGHYVDGTTRRAVTGREADKAAQGYLEQCIKLGDTHSMATMAWMHEVGRASPNHGEPDLAKATEWYERAAAAGSDYARKKLAQLKPDTP